MSRDSWLGSKWDSASLGRYGYVGNRPATLTDPTGRCWPLCFAAVGAGVGAFVGGVVYMATNAGSWDAGGLAGSMAGGAIAGGAAAVAGPIGGSLGMAIAHSATGLTAVAATATIAGLGGAAATEINSFISTGDWASPAAVLHGALLNAAGGVLSNFIFPLRGVYTSAQAAVFGPHSLATLLGRGINATRFQLSAIYSAIVGELDDFFPWNWGENGSRVKSQ
jgi:hypothetical protein